MKSDYLNGTPYTMIQKKDMYHFSGDTELLGRFLKVNHKDTVLDIGCSSGALLLYAAMHQPRSLTGIDLFEEVIETARENMELNGVEADLSVCRLQDFKGKQFSLLICNPPYFNTASPDLLSDNPVIQAARHEVFLTPDELFENSARLMADQAKLMIVHRASRIPELFEKAEKFGLRCVRMKIAYEAEGKRAKSAAMEFRRAQTAELFIEPPAYLNRRKHLMKGGNRE